MKPKKHCANLPPLINGVSTEEVLALWAKGHAHGSIRRRYPALTWMDIENIVHADRYAHIRMSLAEGKTTSQIAREMRCSPSYILALRKKMVRNALLRTEWGGLSARAVTLLKRLGYKTLLELQKDPPTEEQIYRTKGIGLYLRNEIKSVVVFKAGEHPAEAVNGLPAPYIHEQSQPVREEPMMYVTKASHYKGALDNPAAPEPARQLAGFFDAVVKFAQMVPLLPDEMLPSDVPCMSGPLPHHWCLGVVDVFWGHNPLRVYWGCPLCGKKGVVTEVDAPPLTPVPPKPGERLH